MADVNEKGAEKYEVVREGNEDILRIDCEVSDYFPSLEESEICMSRTVEKLVENPGINRLIFLQRRRYEYNYEQTQLLVEIAALYNHLLRQKRLLVLGMGSGEGRDSERVGVFEHLINLLRSDPIGAYVEIKRVLRGERIKEGIYSKEERRGVEEYISLLTYFYELLGRTKLIERVKPYLAGYVVGSRELYNRIFRAVVSPDFIHTKLMARVPVDGEEVDSYRIDKVTDVTIFKVPGKIHHLYHLNPPEFKLSEDKYELLDMARIVLAEHKPREEEFLDPERMRETFSSIGRDMLQELADKRGILLKHNEIKELSNVLVRYTIGFGLIEVLLRDRKIQDIVINSPIGQTPIFIVHEDYDECVTNIIPSREDGISWATKFRLISGRPLDEANPILDTELITPDARARVAVISQPLSPWGLAYAFRRHRDKPWTYPLFIDNKMINNLAAGLLSFFVDGASSIIFAGTRSSGKCMDGDTLIHLHDGDIVPIKELARKNEERINDGFIYDSDNKIITLDSYNLKVKSIDKFWKRNAPSRLLKIRTRSGREIVVTFEHPFFSYDSNNGMVNIRADKINKGDYIAIPRLLPVEVQNTIRINVKLNAMDKVIDYDDHYVIKGRTNSNEVLFPKFMTAELAEFLGYLFGDGNIDGKGIAFHNSNKKLREQYKELIKMFGANYREFRSRTTTVVQINSRLLSRALSSAFDIPFGKKADKIKVPKEVLKSEYLKFFLRAYFDCDGYVPKNKKDLELVTASHDMALQLQSAFLRFGVVVFSKDKVINSKVYKRILIRGNFVDKYSESIGFLHPFKEERLKEIVNRGVIYNTNVDIIPYGGTILKELRKKLRVIPKEQRYFTTKDYWAYENNAYKVSRKWFKVLIDFYKERFDDLLSFTNAVDDLTKFLDDELDIIKRYRELINLLGLSPNKLSRYSSISGNVWRCGLKNNCLDTKYIYETLPYIREKIHSLYQMFNSPLTIDSIPKLVGNTSLTYEGLSRRLEVPCTNLKSYVYGGITVPNFRNEMIDNVLEDYSKDYLVKLQRMFELLDYLESVKYDFDFCFIKDLKNKLNILNKELVSSNVNITTISNFFLGKRVEKSSILKISKRIIDIYYNSLTRVSELLKRADDMANSDIFWDEVLFVERVEPKDNWVYDLSVNDTHSFVANGIIAHNTSLLNSTLVEIMRRYRILTLEDTLELSVDALRKVGYNIQPMKVRSAITGSATEVEASEGIRTALRMGDSALVVGEIRSSIRGNEKVVIVERGETKRVPIKDLEGKEIKDVYVPTMDFDLKVKLTKLTAFVKHPKRKKLLRVKTKTGREVTVTLDHSLFTSHNFKIYPIECKDLKVGSKIVLPARLPCGYNDISHLNLLELINDARVENFEEPIRKVISKIGWKKATSLCEIQSGDIYNYYRAQKTNIPIRHFNKLVSFAEQEVDAETLRIKNGTSNTLRGLLPINEDFCRFLGYFVSEGYFSQSSVILSNNNEDIISDIRYLCKNLFDAEPYIRETYGLGRSKQIVISNSPLVKLLNKVGCGRTSKEKRIPSFIFGLSESKIYAFLSGLYAGDGNFTYSKSSGNAVRYFTTSKDLADDLMYLLLHLGIVARLLSRKTSLSNNTLYVVEFKKRGFVKKFLENVNIVSYDIEELEKNLRLIRKYRHLRKYSSCGKDYLREIVMDEKTKANLGIKGFANGEFYLDEVKEIEEVNLDEGEYVYDLSVAPTQNFIGGFGGILLHNTEAKALFEAMRVGSLANVVAGTIHGDSPYGVFDRVVNDLGVPRTSFKAIDIIVISNPVRSADGLHKWRRVVSITEVRKDWERDPLREKGFVDLMKYDTKEDKLKPTEELLNGDSEILKRIASQVKDWAGNWEALWDNIILRAKMKEALIYYAKNSNKQELLEAEFTINANDMFHRISDEVKEELGVLDVKEIYSRWEDWLKKEIKNG